MYTKLAGGPGSGVGHNNAKDIPILETSPLVSIGQREKFMSTRTPSEAEVKTKDIKYKGQEKYVPKKLKKMIKIWDEVKDKPVDLIKDKKGDLHILDGHHRALAAIVRKEPKMKANLYKEASFRRGFEKTAWATTSRERTDRKTLGKRYDRHRKLYSPKPKKNAATGAMAGGVGGGLAGSAIGAGAGLLKKRPGKWGAIGAGIGALGGAAAGAYGAYKRAKGIRKEHRDPKIKKKIIDNYAKAKRKNLDTRNFGETIARADIARGVNRG